MQKKFYVLLALLFISATGIFAQSNGGSIKGKVFDKDTKEPLPFVTVIIFLNGTTVNGGTTDIDGEYNIKHSMQVLMMSLTSSLDTSRKLRRGLW